MCPARSCNTRRNGLITTRSNTQLRTILLPRKSAGTQAGVIESSVWPNPKRPLAPAPHTHLCQQTFNQRQPFRFNAQALTRQRLGLGACARDKSQPARHKLHAAWSGPSLRSHSHGARGHPSDPTHKGQGAALGANRVTHKDPVCETIRLCASPHAAATAPATNAGAQGVRYPCNGTACVWPVARSSAAAPLVRAQPPAAFKCILYEHT